MGILAAFSLFIHCVYYIDTLHSHVIILCTGIMVDKEGFFSNFPPFVKEKATKIPTINSILISQNYSGTSKYGPPPPLLRKPPWCRTQNNEEYQYLISQKNSAQIIIYLCSIFAQFIEAIISTFSWVHIQLPFMAQDTCNGLCQNWRRFGKGCQLIIRVAESFQ